MKKATFTKAVFWLMVVPLFLFSCEDEMDKHYEPADWLRGSAWEVLSEAGNYTTFLKGVELSDYKPILEGKGVLTVMAPDDAAFAAYLKEAGYPSISDMDKNELNKLIGFHLIHYSYNKERMINYRPRGDQETDEEKAVDAGLYYKFRTRSNDAPTVEIDRTNGKYVTVYHLDRFLPVFSYQFFNTKGIDAKSNYEYFYPNSTWTGANGFNVSGASVNEYEIIADNGYIYKIDRVLKPLETIYTELGKKEKYSTFFNLYNTYSVYEYDETLSKDYGTTLGVDSLYLHYHTDLANIASEWPIADYRAMSILTFVGYSLFAPSNSALNAFYERFWKKGGYESIEEVDPLVMKHLLNQFVYGASIAFPEDIKNGKIKNPYGTVFNFDPAEVKDRAICVNGSFYGLDEINDPPLFGAVVGPAFKYKDATFFLYTLDESSMLNSFVSADSKYTMLIPRDLQMENAGYSMSSNKKLQEETPDGLAEVGSSKLQSIVNMHTINGTDGLKASGTQVYPTQEAFNYLFVKDGMITTNALFNRCVEPDFTGTPFVDIEEITNDGSSWSNGKAYFYDYSDGIFATESTDGLQHALAICNDQRYPYNTFVQLMKKAGMISGNIIPFLSGNRFIAFIPTDEAIKTALASDLIPGIKGGSIAADGSLSVKTANLNTTTLRVYLQSYFLRASENALTTYPYPGSTMKGTYTAANGKQIRYTDSGTSLSVQMEDNNVANVISKYDYFPFAYKDGCFHLIDAIL
ncbi:fasciclin domain-containing protein [Bacteroides sp. 224]|uniref:fasciclin domain-containing protein n=1 Tax=Bacteroides sp. 224 TaxID=2302936 RepID=UPI0013D4093E|nr:fasciclin domain-containing protein [Bacteroides sp. 224]NDV65346.1 fasciclin [Bacteroides sp. 224]